MSCGLTERYLCSSETVIYLQVHTAFQTTRPTQRGSFGKIPFYTYVEKCRTQEQCAKCNDVVRAMSIIKLLMMMAG
jgi:hypothetical protein